MGDGVLAEPFYWQLVTRALFETTPSLGDELWVTFCQLFPQQARSAAWHMGKMVRRQRFPVERQLALLDALCTPQMLLRCAEALSPEGGPRREDVRAFEARVLTYTGPVGVWKSA
jgi:hypothetical protein